MQKIILVSKWTVGMTPVGMGTDKGLNPFKKSKSQLFITKLNEELNNNNLDYEVTLDNDSTSITAILNNNPELVLISPYIKNAILPVLTEEEKQQCYFLTENEYVNLDTANIIKTLE